MDIYHWISLFLMIFMLHNLEEIITIERWFKHTYLRIRENLPLWIRKELDNQKQITAAQFGVKVMVVSIVACLLIILSMTTEHYFLFLGLNMFFALNIFTHPLQSLLLKCYTPGVWTSLLLIIPYNVSFFYYFYLQGLLTTSTVLSGLLVMILSLSIFLFDHRIIKSKE